MVLKGVGLLIRMSSARVGSKLLLVEFICFRIFPNSSFHVTCIILFLRFKAIITALAKLTFKKGDFKKGQRMRSKSSLERITVTLF